MYRADEGVNLGVVICSKVIERGNEKALDVVIVYAFLVESNVQVRLTGSTHVPALPTPN